MVHVDQSVEVCSRCQLRPRRKGGYLCADCHALDMRDRRRTARKRLVEAGLHRRRGRLDAKL